MPRLWIVEDNDQNFELAEFLLAERGYEVARARDAAELRALLSTPAPDLVLLDMHLPGASGLELLAEMRARPSLARVPVVALTAHALRGDRERFLSQGCDGYLSKPIEIRTFVAEVDSFLQLAATRAAEGER
jgi:two-component system cell cycle response regulator DivK